MGKESLPLESPDSQYSFKFGGEFEASPSQGREVKKEKRPLQEKKKTTQKRKKHRHHKAGKSEKLTAEEERRLEDLIQKELAHIDDPENTKDRILSMSRLEVKREIAKLRVWNIIRPFPETIDPMMR